MEVKRNIQIHCNCCLFFAGLVFPQVDLLPKLGVRLLGLHGPEPATRALESFVGLPVGTKFADDWLAAGAGSSMSKSRTAGS